MLKQLQQDFANDLLLDPSEVSKNYQPKNNFSSKQLINVYRNNYYLSLTAALSSTYGAVKRLVGNDFFNYLCKDFIKQYPPKEGSLNQYGAEFSLFLNQHPQCKELAYLADIALLEKYYELAYHAKEAPPYSLQQLSQFSEEEQSSLFIDLHPAVHTLKSDLPVLDIWMMDENSEPPSLKNNAQYALIYRKNYEVQVELITSSVYDFLIDSHKKNLNQLVEQQDKEFNLKLTLLHFIEKQIITNFSLKSE